MQFLERFWHGCGECHGGESCHMAQAAVEAAESGRPFSSGGSLVLACFGVFLVPLTLAILGGWLADWTLTANAGFPRGLCQGVGMVTGLFAGVGVAKLMLRIARHYLQPTDGSDECSHR